VKKRQKLPDLDKINRANVVVVSILRTELNRGDYDIDTMMGVMEGSLNMAIQLAVQIYGADKAAGHVCWVVNNQLKHSQEK
jgi:hypothetical protein